MPGMTQSGSMPASSRLSSSPVFSAADNEFASLVVPKTASFTPWPSSHRLRPRKRSKSGAKLVSNGVTTGASTPSSLGARAPPCLPGPLATLSPPAGFARQQAVQNHRPNAHMDHHIGEIEDVVPPRNMLQINIVDHAAVKQPVEYIAESAAGDKTETDVLEAGDVFGQQQPGGDAAEQRQTQQAEQPALALQQTENATVVADMREVDELVPAQRAVDGNMAVDPPAQPLRQSQRQQGNRAEQEKMRRYSPLPASRSAHL